eukprot:gene15271-6482_t
MSTIEELEAELIGEEEPKKIEEGETNGGQDENENVEDDDLEEIGNGNSEEENKDETNSETNNIEEEENANNESKENNEVESIQDRPRTSNSRQSNMDGDGRQSGQQNKSRMGSATRPVSRPKSNISMGSDELQKLVDEEAGEQQNGEEERELKSTCIGCEKTILPASFIINACNITVMKTAVMLCQNQNNPKFKQYFVE